MSKIFYIDEVRALLRQYNDEQISLSKFVELLNEKYAQGSAPAEPKKEQIVKELNAQIDSYVEMLYNLRKESQPREAEMQKEIDTAVAIIKKIFDEGLISDDERGKEVWHEYQMMLKQK